MPSRSMDPKTAVGRSFIFWAAFLLLLAPGAAAQTTADLIWGERETGELATWRVMENSTRSPFTSVSFLGTWLDLSPHDDALPQSIAFINVAATFSVLQDGDGTFLYQVNLNGVPVPNCSWELTTTDVGGFLAGEFFTYPHYSVACAQTVVLADDAPFTMSVTRTVLAGTPTAPSDTYLSMSVDRGSFIVTSEPTGFELLTGVNGVEFLVFVAVIGLTIILWSRSKDPVVQTFSAVLLMFFAAIAIFLYSYWIGWVPFGAAIGILGAYLLIRSAMDWYQEA